MTIWVKFEYNFVLFCGNSTPSARPRPSLRRHRKRKKRKKDWTDCDENKSSTVERDFGNVPRRASHSLNQLRGHFLPSEAVLRPPQPTSPSLLSTPRRHSRRCRRLWTRRGCPQWIPNSEWSKRSRSLSKHGTILYRWVAFEALRLLYFLWEFPVTIQRRPPTSYAIFITRTDFKWCLKS